MRSLRLDPELDERVRRAAQLAGETVSQFLREAAAERADQTLEASVDHPFADVAGVVHGGGGRARRTGEAFTELIQRRPDPVRRQRRK